MFTEAEENDTVIRTSIVMVLSVLMMIVAHEYIFNNSTFNSYIVYISVTPEN